LCETCYRNKTYDVTKEPWYNSPCQVCGQPMIEKVNIGYQTDVCSELCKYDMLSVGAANGFRDIPQKIRHYINIQNCNEEEKALLEAAEAYYIKRYGQPSAEEYQMRYNNTESWNGARARIEQEADHIWTRTETFFRDYEDEYPTEQAYIEELNRSFIENREAIIERIPKILDLRKHQQHNHGTINLCHGCIWPYDNSDLIVVGNKFLCKYIKNQNEDPCYKGEKDQPKIPENTKEVKEYLTRRNWEYQDRFILYLNKNKERVNNKEKPYECERCEKQLTRPQVQQVVRNVSCEDCVHDWSKQLFEQEKERGTLNHKPKVKTGGHGARERREEKRKGKQIANDSSGVDES